MTSVHLVFSTTQSVIECEGQEGESVMRAAVRSGVPGIIGECGGELSCATCHVIVREPWSSALEPMRADEAEMLEFVEDVDSRSRLGCQIRLTAKLDGMQLDVPDASW
jgi:2Fe-2S ferredoxin